MIEALIEHVAPELAALFRAAADFFDGGLEMADPEDEVRPPPPAQVFRINERGAPERIDGSG